MDIYLRNTENGLIPLYDSDLYNKKRLKIGYDYKAEIKPARNYQFHKKYFALIKCTWLNLPEKFDELYPDPEVLRKALQIQAGFYDSYYLLDGTQIIESKSIAYDCLGEDEFQDLYNKVLDVILKNILPYTSHPEIESEIYKYL